MLLGARTDPLILAWLMLSLVGLGNSYPEVAMGAVLRRYPGGMIRDYFGEATGELPEEAMEGGFLVGSEDAALKVLETLEYDPSDPAY